jgi:integrase
MVRKRNAIPTYRHHKASDQAFIVVPMPDGHRKTIYLGKHNSAASKNEYARIVAELATSPAAAIQLVPPTTRAASLSSMTIAELIKHFWQHAEQYYRRPDGAESSELSDFSLSFAPLRKLYDDTPAADFGPLALKTVRNAMIESGLCRKTTNQRIGRIKFMFKWAASEELLPAAVFHALQTVSGLRKGKSKAKDLPPIKPVSDADFLATLPHCTKTIAAMLRMLRHTGMRPGELIIMRPMDLNTSAAVWTYAPSTHKTQHIGHQRVIFLGPQAQLILKSYLADCPQDGFVFSPARERKKKFDALRAKRKTPVQPSQKDRSNPNAKKRPGARYKRSSISTAVFKACKQAKITNWFPYQLRHSFATESRKQYGLEAAQVLLGHAQANVTQIYAERDHDKARAVAALAG